MFVDSHCHLDYSGLVEDQAAVIKRAREKGVVAMLNIATKEEDWGRVLGTAEREHDIWASVGIHPQEAEQHISVITSQLVAKANHSRVVAIGETGLDYHYDRSDREVQRELFRRHIVAARESGCPVIVHTRDAEADTLDILSDEMSAGRFDGVIHCFTASGDFADHALSLGLYISISGIVTFKNAAEIQETAARIPLDRLLIETDAPFLAPMPHRGKICEPAYVACTAQYLAKLRDTSIEEISRRTSENFFRLFAKTRA